LLSNVSVTSKSISSLRAICQSDLESRTLERPIRPLHTHWWNIPSHNLVTEILQKLTCSKVGTQFALTSDRSSKLTFRLSISREMREPSPCLCPDPISIWQLPTDALCKGKSLQVEQASHPESVSKWALHQTKNPVWIWVTGIAPNPATFDYFLVEKWLLAFAIVCGWFQKSTYALQMLSGMVWLQSCLFYAWQPPDPSIQQSHTSYLSHGSSSLRSSPRLRQFNKPYLLLPKTLLAVL